MLGKRMVVGSFLAVALWLAPGQGHAQVVYDNSSTLLTNALGVPYFIPSPYEIGNEVVLGGTARVVNDFRFEYYGQFTTPTNGTASDENAKTHTGFHRSSREGAVLFPPNRLQTCAASRPTLVARVHGGI